ncbi:MAG: nucleotide exchange factor GrpE [Planctomycetes bacterium]|nr:nucleotide exchange factor GrpE [Planctomycetota bacterium]
MTANTDHDMPDELERDLSAENEDDLPEAEVVEEALSPEERVQRERDEYYENWRRSQADFQNLRRRQAEVIAGSVLASKRELLGELLLVLDYLDMALLTPVETQEGQNLKYGVQLTRDQMMQFLTQREVEPIDTSGVFDPSRHEAVETVETDEVPPGTILATTRSGYTLGKDVLRYANVKVAAAPGSTAQDS